MVGHYRGIQPVNAIGTIDRALNGWITRAVNRGMISGQLGETFFIPTKGRIAADGVVVAGMGDYGRFNPWALRQLTANIAIGAAALGLTSIASVLVGAGDGALDRGTALRAMLEGIGIGLTELREEAGVAGVSLRRLVLIEHGPQRFFQLGDELRSLAEVSSLSTVNLKVHKSAPGDERRASTAQTRALRAATSKRAMEPAQAAPGEFNEVRLTVERYDPRNVFRFSAMTRSAVEPVREVEVNMRNALEAAEALRKARTRDEQEQFGRLLYTYLMPQDFQDLVEGPFPVRLVVDPTSASFPWEMACFSGRGNITKLSWLGTDLRLSRQFKTLLSSAPGVSPPLNDKLSVLVIADPAPEQQLQLPGARTEGRKIVELLKRASGQEIGGSKVSIDVVQRIGPGECDPVEILALLLSGDFDIVHFSGHGDYNPNDQTASGWIFGADRVLTARDIFRARKVPRLVFANACFSGVLREAEPYAPQELSRSLASIAEGFLERGVPNYIGTGWPVDDLQAVTVAKVFYERILQRDQIGNALSSARMQVFDEQVESTWGAYQLYGNPYDTVLRSKAGSVS